MERRAHYIATCVRVRETDPRTSPRWYKPEQKVVATPITACGLVAAIDGAPCHGCPYVLDGRWWTHLEGQAPPGRLEEGRDKARVCEHGGDNEHDHFLVKRSP